MDESAPITVPDAAACRTCGYRLKELTTHQCPECGNAFDPGRPESFRVPQHRSVLDWLKLFNDWMRLFPSGPSRFGWATITLAVLLPIISWNEAQRGDPTLATHYVALCWTVILIRLAMSVVSPRFKRRGPAGWRALTITILVLTWAFLPTLPNRSRTCFHGTITMFGHVGIAQTANCPPCRIRFSYAFAIPLRSDFYIVFRWPQVTS